jgi:DNA polymerase-1
VPGRGGFGDKLLFIAEAPGEQEDKNNTTLCGKAGMIFNRITQSVGMTEDTYFCTNIVKCRPPGNRTPTGAEIESCKRYLWKEIKILDPKIIVLLGASAIKSFFGKSATVKAYRGKVNTWNGYSVFATLHPSSVNYEPYNMNLIVDDMNLLVRYLNGEDKPSEVNYEYSETNKGYHEALVSLGRKRVLSCDVETTSLDMYDPEFRILSLGLSGSPTTGHSFLLNHKARTTSYHNILGEITNYIFKRGHENNPILVGHNFKFDLLCLRAVGIYWDGEVRDTMVMAHLLDENNPDKSLESLALRETNMGGFKDETKEAMDKGKQEELPPEVLMKRNSADCDATLRLHNKYLKELHDQGMIPLLNFQMDVLKMLVDIEWEGWAVHAQNFRELKMDYARKIIAKKHEIWKYSGEINLNSSKQKVKFLYGTLGIEPLSKEEGGKTKGGDDSTSKDVLKKILWTLEGKKRKVIEDLIEYSTLVKRYTFFAQVKANTKKGGKIHASYRQTKIQWGEESELGGTVTGRLSCKNPNVQQIPREGDIKRLFRSKWKTGRLVQLDYSQMELRVLAEISGDRKMCSIFQDDRVDIHTKVASWVYKKPEDQIDAKQRKFTKQVNFGISYMIGPQGLARKLSEVMGHIVRESESRKLMKDWFAEFPQVETWIDTTRRELIRYGEVSTLFGRKRRLADTNPGSSKGREGIRQGVNFLIQSLASDLTLYRAVEFWEWLREEEMQSRIVGLVHDAVIVDCPEREVMKVAKAMRRIFEDNDFTEDFGFQMKVPLKVEIKAGKTWGELEVLSDQVL